MKKQAIDNKESTNQILLSVAHKLSGKLFLLLNIIHIRICIIYNIYIFQMKYVTNLEPLMSYVEAFDEHEEKITQKNPKIYFLSYQKNGKLLWIMSPKNF